MKNGVFQLKGEYRIRWGRIISAASWAMKGPAMAQLDLLAKGYSRIDLKGHIIHRPKEAK